MKAKQAPRLPVNLLWPDEAAGGSDPTEKEENTRPTLEKHVKPLCTGGKSRWTYILDRVRTKEKGFDAKISDGVR